MTQRNVTNGKTTTPEQSLTEPKRGLSTRAKLLIALPVVIVLAIFGYWTISPLFINVTVSESLTADGLVILSQGGFIGADEVVHKAEGTAKALRTQEKALLVRFEEDFKVSNGPDLYVYLIKKGDIKNGFVDLGRLKGNIGSQNYTVPAGTDLSEYDSVIIWCKAFSVLFGTAKFTSL